MSIWTLISLGVLFRDVRSVYIDDSIHHAITYHSIADAPNREELLRYFDAPSDDFLAIRSANDERYVCQLPESAEESIAPTSVYTGPTPADLLTPLITEKQCSYRQDTYWWYELCHGRYLVQFHEDKGTKRRTEFYLGNYKQDYVSLGTSKIEHMNPPKKFIENEERAYYNVSYTQGTHCDLVNGPRTTSVLYMCSEEHKHLFYSYMETSTCKYEVVILTNKLCSHPAYKVKAKKEKHIHCYNVDEEVPAKPLVVQQMDKEHEDTFKEEYILKVLEDVDPGMLKEAIQDLVKELDLVKQVDETPMRLVGERHKGWDMPGPFPTQQILQETVNLILTGKECIEANQGWWNFEICYGKTIKQVHYEGPNRAAEHLLGRFDLAVHKAWVDENPHARSPKVFEDRVMQVSHLYAQGDVCHEIKGHRSVEIRLRCKQAQPMVGTVTLTIEEPSICLYIITVESDRFCEPLQYADGYGIIAVEPVDVGPSVTTDPPPTEPEEDSLV